MEFDGPVEEIEDEVVVLARGFISLKVVWVLLSEIYPTRVRGRAMSVAILALWVGTALIGQVVPWMLETLTPAGTFFVFAICCIPVPFILKKIPETKGMSLEDIEGFWRLG